MSLQEEPVEEGSSLEWTAEENLFETPAPPVEINPAPIEFEVIGRHFLVKLAPGYLDEYYQYFGNLFGKYDQETNTWSFPTRRETDVRNLIAQILSGQLPPPSQLAMPPPSEITIDPASVGYVPYRVQTETAPIVQSVEVVTPRRRPRVSTNQPQVTYTPSQAVQASMQGTVQILEGPTSPMQVLPDYNPMGPDPLESTTAYERRVQLYQYLLSKGLPDQTADVLSRMRNNVDILGVEYNPSAMAVLNAYLPLTQ